MSLRNAFWGEEEYSGFDDDGRSFRFYDGSLFEVSDNGIVADMPPYFTTVEDLITYGELLMKFGQWLEKRK